MIFQPDLKLREAVFKKIGILEIDEAQNGCYWKLKGSVIGRIWSKNNPARSYLPPLETSWEVCAEYLVPFMRERSWGYTAKDYSFMWESKHNQQKWERAEIQNDNIALAACQAFMEVNLA